MKKWLAMWSLFCFLCGMPALAQSSDGLIGINLSAVVDWTTEHPFLNHFKTARPWISQRQGAGWGEGGDLKLTPEGWVAELAPGQFAETLLFTAELTVPDFDGEYVILYDGAGQVAFRGSNVDIVSDGPNRMVVQARPSQGTVFLQIVETDPSNPLRNLRFIRAEYEMLADVEIFSPVFLERIAPFRIIRFMDWMMTNEAPTGVWDERPFPAMATYMERGVPVEVMVALANRIGAHAWFNMPHIATDDYVRNFATLVRDQLNPDLKAYIEYSNETWNGIFPQASYVVEEGLRLGLGQNDAFWAGLQFHSQRAVAFFAIWEEVFGGTDRLVRILASQSGNSWTGEQVADYNDAFQKADALAIAPYFSCDDPAGQDRFAQTLVAGVDALLAQQLVNVLPGGCAYEEIQFNLEVAQAYGLDLIAYEGGQHLAGYFGTESNEELTALFIQANRDPRMGEIYTAYLQAWQDLGAGDFALFSDATQPSRFGSWGLLEYITQDANTAPKYQAALAFIAAIGQ